MLKHVGNKSTLNMETLQEVTILVMSNSVVLCFDFGNLLTRCVKTPFLQLPIDKAIMFLKYYVNSLCQLISLSHFRLHWKLFFVDPKSTCLLALFLDWNTEPETHWIGLPGTKSLLSYLKQLL